MAVKVAINGFGRIGRLAFKIANEKDKDATDDEDDIDDYTLKMTPQTFDKLGGNTSSSSLDKMLGMVINNMNNSTVSVFVSDCILGVSYGQADKYFSMAKDNVKKVFVNALEKHKDLGVEIFCLNSRFKGKYYQYGKTPQ